MTAHNRKEHIMHTFWTRNHSTRRRLIAWGLLSALALPALATAAEDKPKKPTACLAFKVYVAESGAGKLVVCYDNKRPFTFESAVITKLPDGRPVAVGVR